MPDAVPSCRQLYLRPECERQEFPAGAGQGDVKKASGNRRQVASGMMWPLIQGLEVEFDDVAVGIEDVDLRVAGEGVWAEFHLPEVTIGNIVAESLGAEPSQGIAIALHPECEMNVIGIVRLVAAKRRIRAHYDV